MIFFDTETYKIAINIDIIQSIEVEKEVEGCTIICLFGKKIISYSSINSIEDILVKIKEARIQRKL